MDECKHGNTSDCALCRLEDEEHDAAMGAQFSDDKGDIAALRKDAERYRFLRNDFSVMGANIDGQHSRAYRRNFSLRGPTPDAAIDTAMGAPL